MARHARRSPSFLARLSAAPPISNARQSLHALLREQADVLVRVQAEFGEQVVLAAGRVDLGQLLIGVHGEPRDPVGLTNWSKKPDRRSADQAAAV